MEKYLFDLGSFDQNPLQQKHLLTVSYLVVFSLSLQQNPLPFPRFLLSHAPSQLEMLIIILIKEDNKISPGTYFGKPLSKEQE